MQRKYNMALQHFYEAATHNSNDKDEMKAKLQDLSGSEEDVFNLSEKGVAESTKESNGDENNYFNYDGDMSVKRVKPVSICSWRGSTLLCIWCVLFILGVISISYCLQIAITRIPDKGKTLFKHDKDSGLNSKVEEMPHNYTKPCADFQIEKVWSESFEKLRASSPLRVIDVDGDGVGDVLYGFTTNLGDGPTTKSKKDINEAKQTCKKYYNGTYPCFGGVAAVNGITGKLLWTHYTTHGVSSIVCNGDLNNDGYADCLCAGHGDLFEAISSKTGLLIWAFQDTHEGHRSGLRYKFAQPQFINDMDGDGILDVLQFHGGHAAHNATKTYMAKALFVSGKTGKLLKSTPLSTNRDSHSSPVVYLGKNKAAMVVYGTGDENSSGDLFAIKLRDLYSGMLNQSTKILSSPKKGFMNPPNLVDVNGDGTVDIISAGIGDKIYAIDGQTNKVLWVHHSSGTETYSTPALGYFNEDDTVDLMVRVNTGTEYPVYYDSKITILDGKTGLPMGGELKTSVPTHTSPLSVSMEGMGKDLFVYWAADCVGHEHEGGWYNFVDGTDRKASAESDSCYGRFGANSSMKLNIMNEKIGFPGKAVYISNQSKEHKEEVTTGIVMSSLVGHNEDDHLSNTFDVVFVTSAVVPMKVRVLTPTDVECIKKNKTNFKSTKDSKNKKGIYDNGDAVTNYCLSKRLPNEVYDDPKKQKNFNKGQLTVHRYKLTCLCDKGGDAVRVLPRREQGWSQSMGSLGNGFFNRRAYGRLHRT